MTLETPFGQVSIGPDSVMVSADSWQLRNWANRPGSCWPCSELVELETVSAVFDTNGLLDIEQDPDADHVEISGAELSAWTSDAIGAVLAEDHPCHFITVGQFRG